MIWYMYSESYKEGKGDRESYSPSFNHVHALPGRSVVAIIMPHALTAVPVSTEMKLGIRASLQT